MADDNNGNNTPSKGGGYGKRPLWQWILIYVIIGGIVYYGIYYFYLRKHGGYSTGSSTTQTSPY